MQPNLLNRIPKVLLLAFLFFSCSSDLDFDQVNDLKIEPVFVANLAYFDIAGNKIDDNGQGQEIPPDVEDFDIFRRKFFTEHLTKAALNFEIENTVNRAFSLDLVFLDASDQVLQTLTFPIPAYSGTSNVIKYPEEVYENQRLVLLKQTTKVSFVVRMSPGPPINENTSGNLKLRSSATVYMVIE